MLEHPRDSLLQPPPLRVSAGTVPPWDLQDLVKRDCPGCLSPECDSLCLRPDGLQVVRCRTCGLAFVKAAPSEAQLTAFYQNYAFYKGYSPDQRVRTQRFGWLDLTFRCSQSLYIEALENTGGIAGKTVLDMGCSTGDFMQLVRFKQGLPQGVEIDESARAAAESIGFQVSSSAPEHGSFEIVTAFQVIEHLRDPRHYIATMARLVRPEGRVVIAVPNATEVRDFGGSWLGFRVDLEHLNFFDIRSLCGLLEAEGLFVEHCWQHLQPALHRTDLPVSAASKGIGRRAAGWMEQIHRILHPPPQRFLEGSFVLSIIARRL
jgi:SAM-dependent methyltransferase